MGMHGDWHGVGMILAALLFLVPLWKIVSKAGFHGAWSLLALVPLVNLVALWAFAFMKWPGGHPRA